MQEKKVIGSDERTIKAFPAPLRKKSVMDNFGEWSTSLFIPVKYFLSIYPPYQPFYFVGGYSPSLNDILPDPYN
jgi:hypothetical protein